MSNLYSEKRITADDFVGKNLLVYISKYRAIDKIMSREDIEACIEECRNKGFNEQELYHTIMNDLYGLVENDDFEIFDLELDISIK